MGDSVILKVDNIKKGSTLKIKKILGKAKNTNTSYNNKQ
jgi:hypothetical protein